MRKKLLLITAMVIAIALLVSGCQPVLPQKIIVTGGGWILPPELSEGKASFGFTAELYDIVTEPEMAYSVRGRLTYIDHVNGVKVIGAVTGVLEGDPGGFTGTYCDGGIFMFTPVDDETDAFAIHITGGEYDGYMNEGLLEGGSIQVVSVYD